MFSTGQWHKKVPKDKRQNLRFKLATLHAVEKDRRLAKSFVNACKEDIIFFVNAFVWQFNPRKKGSPLSQIGPFITWDFQDAAILEMLECIEIDEDLCIEKSREMGASWMLIIVFFWMWAFHGWNKFLLISRNADAVEADDPDSLMWKFDFILEHTPDWLCPKEKTGGLKKKKFFRGNLKNKSTLTGQASTGKAGVGGRATAMGIDEFSQIEEDFEVLHRTSDTTGCRIFNFTHTGLSTAAYEITQRVDMRKLVLHWTQHPEKRKGLYKYDPDRGKVEVLDHEYVYPVGFRFVMDGSPTGGPYPGVRSPWYDEQCKRKGSARAIAMDLDIDPKGSVSQFFDRLMILTLQTNHCCEPYWEGDLHFNRDTGRPIAMIPQKGGPLKLWCKLRRGVDTNNKMDTPPFDYYGIGCDVAAGTGATPSCASAISGSTGEKVMEYRNPHILPDKFGAFMVAMSWLFRSPRGDGALLSWEVPGPGYTFGKIVTDLGYRHIYYKRDDFVIDPDESDRPGWHNTTNSMRALMEDYRMALNSRQCLNRSKSALAECLAFKYDKRGNVEHGATNTINDPSGARVNHSDVVIADAQAWKMAKSFGLGQKGPSKVEEGIPILSLQWRRDRQSAREREAEAWG